MSTKYFEEVVKRCFLILFRFEVSLSSANSNSACRTFYNSCKPAQAGGAPPFRTSTGASQGFNFIHQRKRKPLSLLSLISLLSHLFFLPFLGIYIFRDASQRFHYDNMPINFTPLYNSIRLQFYLFIRVFHIFYQTQNLEFCYRPRLCHPLPDNFYANLC